MNDTAQNCEAPMELRAAIGRDRALLTRQRYLELTEIAQNLCDMLEKMGVKPHEGCTIRQIAESLWNLK